jgi:hypothetical protein
MKRERGEKREGEEEKRGEKDTCEQHLLLRRWQLSFTFEGECLDSECCQGGWQVS